MSVVTFEVIGTPAPQGDKSAIIRGGKPRMIEGKSGGARQRHKSWRAAVADVARDVSEHNDVDAPLDGALHLEVEFRCAMPASRPKRIQTLGECRHHDHADGGTMNRTVALDLLVQNPDNPRDTLGDVTELAASIVAIGLLQPLLVVEHEDEGYMVVDGHRRLAAMQSVGYAEPIAVVVTEMDRTQRLVAAVAAGAFTRRLSAIERARAFKQLRDDAGLTQGQIAERVGCSIVTVNIAMRLLDLDEDSIADVEAGRLSAQQAIKRVRQSAPKPQGRKPRVARIPDPNEHPLDLTICLTVAGSTDDTRFGRDVSGWFERQHQLGRIPHSAHIVSIDDWRATA